MLCFSPFARLTPRAPRGGFGAAAPHTGTRTHPERRRNRSGRKGWKPLAFGSLHPTVRRKRGTPAFRRAHRTGDTFGGERGEKEEKERKGREKEGESGFFGEGVGEEVEEGTEGAVVFGSAVGPGGVGEVVGAAGSETTVLFQAQELGLGMVAVVAFGDGFQAVAVPAGIEFVEVGGGDDFLELLDVVDDGFAQLFEHGTFGTPDAAVEAPLDLPLVEAGAHVEVEAGEVGGACAAAVGAEGGGEVILEGGFVEGEAGVAVYAVGGFLGGRGAEGGPPLADCGKEAVDVGEPEGAEVVVFGAVCLEPIAVLAAAELFKEAV